MCSMIAVAIGVEGAATLMKGAAEKQHGDAVKASEYRSGEEAERAAADAIERGRLKDTQVAMHSSAVVAEQRVIQSGTGADLNVGAPKDTQTGTESVADVDRAVVRRNAALEAYGLRVKARGHYQQGQNAEAAGKAAMWGTFLGGLGKIGALAAMFGADKAPVPDGASAEDVPGMLGET